MPPETLIDDLARQILDGASLALAPDYPAARSRSCGR